QREDLNPIEEAESLKRLKDRRHLTDEALARIIGKSRVSVTESLSLTALPEPIKAECRRADHYSKRQLLGVLRAPTSDARLALWDDALRRVQGFTQIPNPVLKHPAISYGAKVALGVLLSYAWQEDFCFPAQERLAKDLNCSVRNVQRLLKELKAASFIDWKQQG